MKTAQQRAELRKRSGEALARARVALGPYFAAKDAAAKAIARTKVGAEIESSK